MNARARTSTNDPLGCAPRTLIVRLNGGRSTFLSSLPSWLKSTRQTFTQTLPFFFLRLKPSRTVVLPPGLMQPLTPPSVIVPFGYSTTVVPAPGGAFSSTIGSVEAIAIPLLPSSQTAKPLLSWAIETSRSSKTSVPRAIVTVVNADPSDEVEKRSRLLGSLPFVRHAPATVPDGPSVRSVM